MDEIADREANQTFFGFLNTEPAVDRPTSKRVKSRPASVGSLGSMVVSSSPSLTTTTTTNSTLKESKKPQLKARAVSAIMTSSNMIPKKMKPSQSMPLSKKQQLLQKKSAPRKNSATPASTTYDHTTSTTNVNATATANATTVSVSSSPTDIEHDDNTLYSSTAYINSNITLNKAFKPQRGNSQMASMIPIATRTQLITTKSL